MQLAESDLQKIRLELERSGLTITLLFDDLLDHLCCVVEDKMNHGNSFDKALSEAIRDLAPNGLYQIEQETLFLLNHNKLMLMKKMIFLSGSIFAILVSSGFFLKVLHWSLGDTLLTLGSCGLLLIFLPLVLVHNFRSALPMVMSERMRLVFGVLSAVFIGMGVVLKINHFVGANLSLLIGGIIFSFGFIPFIFYSMYRKSTTE